MEKNKVSISISNQKYTIISGESPESVKKLADIVNEKVTGLIMTSKISLTEALVLTALDFADEKAKMEEEVKKLKGDMAAYLEDVENITIERDKLRRELDKLKK